MKFNCIKTPEEFKKSKEETIDKLKDFYDTYSEFCKFTKPSEWRMTGHHLAELKKMQIDITRELGPLTMKDLESEFLRKQVLSPEEQELWNSANKYNL